MERLTTWVVVILGVAIVLKYLIPWVTCTDDNPTGSAGLFAPIVAMFTALAVWIRGKNRLWHPIVGVQSKEQGTSYLAQDLSASIYGSDDMVK